MNKGPASTGFPDPGNPAHRLPAVMARNESRVRGKFWHKLLKAAGHVPFAEEAAAAYFCALDPKTPARVRAALLAALAYFITPMDVIPDVVIGIGFTDDAAVMMAAISVVSGHMKERHRKAARKALGLPEPGEGKED